MIIFLSGPDTYRLKQKLQEIVEHYQKTSKKGLSLKYFEGPNLSFTEFRDEFQQTSIFDDKKLLIIQDIVANQDFKESFAQKIKEFSGSPSVILFYQGGEPKKDKFFNSLEKYGKSQKFELLSGEKLKNWFKKEFLRYEAPQDKSPTGQAKIEENALVKLIDFVGNNLWQAENEIRKLASYKDKKIITAQDVEILVKPKVETDIFKTIDALALGNKKQALSLIHRHLEKGDHPLYLLSMITFQFRNLLIVKQLIESQKPYYLIAKESKLHPFVVRKCYGQASKFTFPQLKKIYQKIFEADLNIKTGKIAAETALDLLIAEI